MHRRLSKFVKDTPTLFVIMLICFIGLATVYSAAFQNGIFSKQDVFMKQLLWFVVGLVLYFLTIACGHRKILSYAYVLYGFMVVLLVMVLVIGAQRLGAQRWFSIFGFNFQPSEISKLIIILFLAKYLSRFYGCCTNNARIPFFSGFMLTLLLVGFPAFLIFIEPDLGTAFVLFPTLMIMVYYAGVKLRYIMLIVVTGLAVSPFAWHILKPYQKNRLLVFLNPNLDPLGAGYTIIQSKIAIGSGRLFGKGWLAGTQNQLNFLPERHTDFIFSIIGEEYGFLGSFLLIGLFLFLIFRIISFISETTDPQSQLLIVGIAAFFSTQIVINIAMTIGLLPVVGVPLPFISYGGTSMLLGFVALGLASSVYREKML